VVTAAGAIKGILTHRDLLACIGTDHDPSRCKVALHMSRPVFVLRPDEDVVTAADVMLRRHIKRLAVAEGGKLLGIVSLSDLANFGAAELNTATRFVSSLISAQGADARPAKLRRAMKGAPADPAAGHVSELMAREKAIS
jgi:signal-transduction protein with cAMP-binding, CBS, and nucleotidyltransferase domain